MRVGELCSRTWKDVLFERNLIRVDDQPACGFSVKNDPSRRNVPMLPLARQVLERRAAGRISEGPMEPVFLKPRHKTAKHPFLSHDWVSRRFTEHRLPEGTIHSTRHSLITYLLAMGYGESQVMRVVGHVKSDTLAVYTHMIEEILQDAATAAFARLFPDEEQQEPKLVREMGLILKGEPLPEDTSNRTYVWPMSFSNYLATEYTKGPPFSRVESLVPRTGFEDG